MISVLKDIISSPQFRENGAWTRRRFDANEMILTEGEEGSTLFFIEQGTVRVTGQLDIEDHSSLQPGICDLEVGDVFGEICLYGPHPRSASVIAVTDGSLIEVDGERLSIWLDANPIEGYLLLKELFQTLGERLNRANHQVKRLSAWGLKTHGIIAEQL